MLAVHFNNYNTHNFREFKLDNAIKFGMSNIGNSPVLTKNIYRIKHFEFTLICLESL